MRPRACARRAMSERCAPRAGWGPPDIKPTHATYSFNVQHSNNEVFSRGSGPQSRAGNEGAIATENWNGWRTSAAEPRLRHAPRGAGLQPFSALSPARRERIIAESSRPRANYRRDRADFRPDSGESSGKARWTPALFAGIYPPPRKFGSVRADPTTAWVDFACHVCWTPPSTFGLSRGPDVFGPTPLSAVGLLSETPPTSAGLLPKSPAATAGLLLKSPALTGACA